MVPLVSLKKREHELSEPETQIRILGEVDLPKGFAKSLAEHDQLPLKATQVEIFQVNVGKICNLTCAHCHVDAGPDRKETMSDEVFDRVLEVFENSSIPTIDITGGAAELHPRFREMIERCASMGRKVMHRCNLTAMMTRPCRDIPELLAKHKVEIVASLPNFVKACTDKQRGDGVFEILIQAIRRLNELGYGKEDSGLVLNLITNPVGAILPFGTQEVLQEQWKKALKEQHGLEFNQLFVLTNLPIGRFLESLVSTDSLDEYMTTIAEAFNPVAAEHVMCKNMISVGWDGNLYDCDFNQMLELKVEGRAPQTIFDWDQDALEGRNIVIDEHCFGCTAGAGASCGGQTT